MDAAQEGVSQTYLYELLDEYADPTDADSNDHWGLFNADNSPKPVALAIHDLTTILADNGADSTSFDTGTLDYTLSGLPWDGNSLLLEKSDGSFDLAVWAEPTIWDPTTLQEITVAATPVTISLGQVAASVEVYDPLSGSTPIATYSDVDQVTIAITDHPLIVEIDPVGIVGGSTGEDVAAGSVASSGTTTPASAPTISGTVAGQNTASEAAVAPFSAVTIGDSNSGATESLTITLSRSGGTLSGNGLSGGVGGVYTLSGTAATVTTELDALVFIPSAGAASSSNTTSFALSDQSSATTAATDSTTTVVIDTDPAASKTTPTSTPDPTTTTTATPRTDPAGVTVGTGPDQLVLQISEDAYLGNANFTVDINGVQQGGTLTTTAINGDGETQAFIVEGSFGTGSNTVTVDFLNDLYAGTPETDRNLYVDGAAINRTAITGAALNEYSAGAQSFTFAQPAATTAPSGSTSGTSTSTSSSSSSSSSSSTTDPTTTTPTLANPATATVGTGPDRLVLQISEDAYLGNADFTISVNGVQQGGTLTTTAINGQGETQTFTFDGTFTGSNTVTVDFLNDLYAGTPETDRNLYVDSATINGTAITGAALNEYSAGAQSFTFAQPAATTAPSGSTSGTSTSTSSSSSSSSSSSTTDPTTTTPTLANPAPVTVGTGPDQLVLQISEDAYQGNAKFTISVDGVQQGGTLTTTAINGDGETQAFIVNGSFGTGSDDVTVNFLNDLYAGTPETDRNLYVDGATINGTAVANSGLNEYSAGAQSFTFAGNDSDDASQPAPVAIPSAAGAPAQATPDTLTIALTEGASKTAAMASISINGQTLGTPTVTFQNSGGTSELFTYTGDFGGPDAAQNIAVGLLNGTAASANPNLFVKSVSFDGTTYQDQRTFHSPGTVNFTIPASTPMVGLSNQHNS